MANPPGVVCLEGDWYSFDDRTSIEPALTLLEQTGTIRLIHRNVATIGQLEHYLNQWFGLSAKEAYDIGYLGFHGSSGTLYVGDEEIGLDQLGRMIDGRCKNKVLYFGSCKVMASTDAELRSFCRRSGASAIAGYTRDVDWAEAAAFELLLISELAAASRMKPVHDRLSRLYPDFTKRLGFRMAGPAWSSSQQVAVNALKAP